MNASKTAYEYFKGKVCTIFVGPTARELTPEQFNDYFVGAVDQLDDTGILTTHAITGCKNFFPWRDVIGICEEQVLYPDNPEDAKLIQEFEKKKSSVKVGISPRGVGESDSLATELDRLSMLSGVGREMMGS